MMIFNELRKHARLAAKRHPMYEKNKFGKFLMYIGVIFWGGYLIFFGTTFAFMFRDMVPNWEPYHVMNGGVLIVILILDFILRFPFQKTPTQEVKPYLLLPVKRKRLIDFLLIRSGLSNYNLIWLCMFVPFAIITVTKFFGILGVISYCLGIWLVIVVNNYWYLFCRTLIDEHLWWIFLPVLVYLGIIAALIIPGDDKPIFNFLLNVGDGFIRGNILYFLGTAAIIALWWLANRKLMSGLIYAELSKSEDVKVKHVSEFKIFDKYGEVGEYMRLEVKMLLRNKRCKGSLRMVGLCVIAFSLLLSFTDAYDGLMMNTFVTFYAFAAFGMVILSQVMGFEGNYLDGLMSRKESIANLLKAKYYIYCIGEILPLLLMTPAIIMGKLTLLNALAWVFFTMGPVYCLFFQMAVFNKQTVPLNDKLTGRQANNNVYQLVLNLATFGLPLIFYVVLNKMLGAVPAQCILLVIGIGFTLTSGLWIQNVYRRFMKRRYENMEGFRNSRQ